jgi:nucleoside-diphosphate-sugar epimerase
MSHVLLTGADGFIGSHELAPLPAACDQVHAVSSAFREPLGDVTWHSADVFDADAAPALMAEVVLERLVHLAWYAEPGRFRSAPENERWVDAMRVLPRAFHAASETSGLISGSCAEYVWWLTQLGETAAQ